MKHNLVILFFLLLFFEISHSQSKEVPVFSIPDSLRENANSIIQQWDTDVAVLNQKSLKVKFRKKVLVLNEEGFKNSDIYIYYDKSLKVRDVEVKHLDVAGNEIKVFRKKDFKDKSVADGFSVFTDSRVLLLDFTPVQYPFVLDFTYETETENTAFIPSWNPIENVLESVKSSTYSITFPENLGFRYKESNFDGFNIFKEATKNKLIYKIENIPAVKKEDFSLPLTEILPYVNFALDKFNYEGVQGESRNWKEFGLWMNNSLLKGLDVLPEETVASVQKLVANQNDPLKKAEMVYNYMQSKTRYVSIQMGIGGWKPMPAKDVDRLGYGDCKALTNYTMALLKAVDIPSYYTIVYGNSTKRNLIGDFASLQGNHAILAIPFKDKMYYLECTSQHAPFGFEGDFTDGRNVLLVKPDGGEITKTNSYENETNLQETKAICKIDENGTIDATLSILSKGLQYDSVYEMIRLPKEKVTEHYKKKFFVLKNANIQKYTLSDNKKDFEFKEDIILSSSNFGEINQGTMLFPLNAFNQNTIIPQRYRNRKFPFQISRGFYDVDEYEINLPEGFQIESIPENFKVSDIFGEYEQTIEKKSDHKVVYRRILLLKAGKYSKDKYEGFRKFREKIARSENKKIVLKRNN